MNLSLRFKEFLNLIVFSKKIFNKPEQKDILIFDSDLSEFFIHYLNKEKVHILDNRYKQHKNQKLNIFILFKMALKFKFSSYEYFKSYLNYVSPKLILTLTDNNKAFYKLKEMYPKAKTILVQNAWRTADFNDIFKNMDTLLTGKFKCDFILSFNKHIGEKFKSFLHGEVVPIGSFRSNHNSKKNLKKKYDYLFISIFREQNTMFDCHFDLLKTINKFFSEKKEKLYVLGSYGLNSKKEKIFYDKYLNATDYIFIPRTKERPTYEIVDQSKIVLTVESTLGYEAIARSNKVAYFSLRKNTYPDNTVNFGWPANKKTTGPFWVNSSDITTFKNLMHYLENINDEEYFKILKEHTSDLIEHDDGNNKFKNLILTLLKTK